ncbi:MAG: hypothetical protein NC911_01095, partial [Candidatus Omnitrophica bacterium]|nr:hypothetical protein [Candidatus Omnitrophota bacterium]
KEVVVGFNFCFGAHRKGTTDFLQEVAPTFGLKVTVVPPVIVGDSPVNSTRIRQSLQTGRVEEANECLGRLFSFRGRVITGEQRGKFLGFPTANLYVSQAVKLRFGVYACWIKLKDEYFRGAMNIGVSPTFGHNEETVEVHLLDFSEDIYGQELIVYVMKYLRSEKAFPGVESLRNQLKEDMVEVRRVLSHLPRFD